MSSKVHMMLAAVLVIPLVACSQTDESTGIDPPGTTATADPATSPTDTSPTAPEGEALAFLVAVNEHEIAAAEQARTKGVEGKVLEFADMLHTEHSRNLAETRALADRTGGTTHTQDIDALETNGRGELDKLGALTGEAYAPAYVDAMVKGHTDALATIDGRLLAAVADGPVKEHLTAARATIAKHLEAAKALQADTQPPSD